MPTFEDKRWISRGINYVKNEKIPGGNDKFDSSFMGTFALIELISLTIFFLEKSNPSDVFVKNILISTYQCFYLVENRHQISNFHTEKLREVIKKLIKETIAIKSKCFKFKIDRTKITCTKTFATKYFQRNEIPCEVGTLYTE